MSRGFLILGFLKPFTLFFLLSYLLTYLLTYAFFAEALVSRRLPRRPRAGGADPGRCALPRGRRHATGGPGAI